MTFRQKIFLLNFITQWYLKIRHISKLINFFGELSYCLIFSKIPYVISSCPFFLLDIRAWWVGDTDRSSFSFFCSFFHFWGRSVKDIVQVFLVGENDLSHLLRCRFSFARKIYEKSLLYWHLVASFFAASKLISVLG